MQMNHVAIIVLLMANFMVGSVRADDDFAVPLASVP